MQLQPVPSFSLQFKEVVNYFAEKYFINETKENLFAKVCFFQHHPKINEDLFYAVISMTILSRPDFSNDILSRIEVRSHIWPHC